MAGLWLAGRPLQAPPLAEAAAHAARVPRWDIPIRMVTATGVVIIITGLAGALGPLLSGLLPTSWRTRISSKIFYRVEGVG